MIDKKMIASEAQIESKMFLRGQKVMPDADLKSQFVTSNNVAKVLNTPCA